MLPAAAMSGRRSRSIHCATGGVANGLLAAAVPKSMPAASTGRATTRPAIGPAIAMSKSCRRLAREPSMPITAPSVPVSSTGTGMKKGSVAGMRCSRAAMKWPASCADSTAITAIM